MIVATGPDTTVFRTSHSSRRLLLSVALPLLALCPLPVVIAVIIPAAWPVAVVFLITPVVSFAWAICFWFRSRVEFGGGRYQQTFAFRTHRFVIDDVAKIIAVDAFDYGMRVSAHVFVVGTRDRRLARLNDLLYERQQLESWVADLVGRGVAMERIHDRVTMRQFDRLHPGVLNPWESYRVRFLALTGVAVLAAFAAAALLTLWLLGAFA
jgi:hypothetical protein